MFERVEITAILGSASLLLIVLELVRRKRLKEEYSLLWLLTCIVLLVLSFWRGLLDVLARLVGIFYPPTALFVVGLGFVLLILLHFSTVISKLSTENKELAQRLVPFQGESDISVIASVAKQSPRSREKPIAWHKWGLLRRSAPRNDMHHNHTEKVLAILSWKLRNLEGKAGSESALEEQEDKDTNETAR